MHTLPAEVGDRIGTSMLFAAWNAAIYVNQIEDERLGEVVATGTYLDATQAVLRKHGGLWFNDESFVVSRGVNTSPALLAGDRHLADQDRAHAHAAAQVDVAADGGDVAVHLLEIPGDGDLVHGIQPARRSPPSSPTRRANSRR